MKIRIQSLARALRRPLTSHAVSVDDASDVRPIDRVKPPMSRVAPSPAKDEHSEDEPSLGRSNLLLDTDEKVRQARIGADQALATPGLTFADGHGVRGPTGKGRQTRRMNYYQSVRDGLG